MGGVVSGITDAVGITDSKAGERAAKAQGAAAAQANQTQRDMYEQNKEMGQDWIDKGEHSLEELYNMAHVDDRFSDVVNPLRGHSGVFGMDDFKQDPGYQFRMDEGKRAIERSAAARGGLNSGGAMKALASYSQNLASEEYDRARNRFNQDYSNAYNRFNNDETNRFNRLNTITNYGRNTMANIMGQGSSMANNISNNMIGVGNANAAAEMSRHKMGMGGLIEQAGPIATAAMMACWVAREIFGDDNPKWLMARNFILNIGPEWFKNLYLKHGESFAEKLKEKPILKIFIRPAFEVFALIGSIPKNKVGFAWR